MVETPSILEVRTATGISQSYASMILSGTRQPPRPLAIRIFRMTGWRHTSIADLTDVQIDTLEEVDPWPPAARSNTSPDQQDAA